MASEGGRIAQGWASAACALRRRYRADPRPARTLRALRRYERKKQTCSAESQISLRMWLQKTAGSRAGSRSQPGWLRNSLRAQAGCSKACSASKSAEVRSESADMRDGGFARSVAAHACTRLGTLWARAEPALRHRRSAGGGIEQVKKRWTKSDQKESPRFKARSERCVLRSLEQPRSHFSSC